MIPVFSFKKPLVANILECAGVIFPGIQKAVAIGYDKDADEIIVREYLHENNSVIEVDSGKYNLDIDKERKTGAAYNWINPKTIEEENTVQKQLGIYDENENNVLLIRIENRYDKLFDLLFLYMNKHMPVFQMDHNRAEISGREKTLLARTIVNNIGYLKKQIEQDTYLFSIYNQSVILTRAKLTEAEQLLEDAKQNYAASIIAFCKHEINLISKETDLQIKLTDEALKILSSYKGEFKDLTQILRNSVMVALNVNTSLGNASLVIDKHDITFDLPLKKQDTEKSNSYIFDRYSRTRDLLNRYENAARIAKEKGLPVTGKNIGKFCQPPITAPAISDSLVNHQKKIITLLNESSDKWPIIRNEFRSIINLQTKYAQRMVSIK